MEAFKTKTRLAAVNDRQILHCHINPLLGLSIMEMNAGIVVFLANRLTKL